MKREQLLSSLTKLFLFLLPWQTVWIAQERFLNGVKWQYGTLQFFATEFILWITIFVFMFYYMRAYRKSKREKNFGRDRLYLLSLFLLITYAMLSKFWAVDSALAAQYSLYIMEAIFLFFILAFGPLSFREMLRWFIFGSIIPAILGIAQFVSQTAFASTVLGLAHHDPLVAGTSIIETRAGERLLRAYGTFSHPNSFGGYLFFVSMAFVALYYFFAQEFSKHEKIIFGISGIIIFHGLFFTFSRSAWLAFVLLLGATTVCALKYKHEALKKLCMQTGILIIIVLAAYRGYIVDRFTFQNSHEVASVTERVDGVKEAWSLFKQNIFVGVGGGNYTAASYVAGPGRAGWAYQPVHNVFLLFLVEWGIVGAVLIVLVKSMYVYNFGAYIKKYSLPLSVFLFSILPLALFDHYLLSSYVGCLLIGIFGGMVTRCILVNLSTNHPLSVHRG